MNEGTKTINVRLDNHTVAWLDAIAVGAATDRATVAAVLLALRVGVRPVSSDTRTAPPIAPRVLTIPQAAAALGVHASAIHRNLSAGKLTRHKEGRHTLIEAREIEAMRDTIKPRKKRTANVRQVARTKRKGRKSRA